MLSKQYLPAILKSFLVFSSICFLSFGVMRHDVDEAEYIKLGAQKQFHSVGQVIINNAPKGSCVLIGSKYIISAAHVFMEYGFRKDTLKVGGQTVISNVAFSPRVIDASKCILLFNGKEYQAKSIIIHPEYLKSTKGSRDIVIVELHENVNDIIPAKLNKSFNELNSDVVGVGFGASGIANKPKTVTQQHKKIGGENVIDSIGGEPFNKVSTLLFTDFDSPIDKSLNRLGSDIPKPLEYSPTGGDSGGGLFMQEGNSWKLVGIVASDLQPMESFAKNGYYGGIGSWTRISAFHNWILEVTGKL